MSKTADALIICGEINDMVEFWQDDLNTDLDELNTFMGWAVEQHRSIAKKDFGIDDATLDQLLREEISFQVDCLIASDDDEYDRNYQEIALALYRYYLQAYKSAKADELTYEDIELLNNINKIRLG